MQIIRLKKKMNTWLWLVSHLKIVFYNYLSSFKFLNLFFKLYLIFCLCIFLNICSFFCIWIFLHISWSLYCLICKCLWHLWHLINHHYQSRSWKRVPVNVNYLSTITSTYSMLLKWAELSLTFWCSYVSKFWNALTCSKLMQYLCNVLQRGFFRDLYTFLYYSDASKGIRVQFCITHRHRTEEKQKTTLLSLFASVKHTAHVL